MRVTRRGMLGTLAAGAGWAALAERGAGAETGAAPGAAEQALRAYLEAQIVFRPFVFTGEAFPRPEFARRESAEAYLGRFDLQPVYYDRRVVEALQASRPGPYAAVIRVASTQARAARRLATLYRLAEPLPDDWRFAANEIARLARCADIKPESIMWQAGLVAATCKGRAWRELAQDARVARLLAGLHEDVLADRTARRYLFGAHFTPPDGLRVLSADNAADREGASREMWQGARENAGAVAAVENVARLTMSRNVDAFASERQWWVNVKRRLSGRDGEDKRAAAGPDAMRGKPAPMLRAGRLDEAGFKPDASDKIHAALTAWAGDTNQAFAVCVARHGVIAFHRAYGTRDGRPMTLDTKSWMASITKPMCATLMMMLVDRGLVDLDEPIAGLRGIRVETPLTVRHLYTHTSGLDKWPAWSDELPDVEDQLADAYPFVRVGKVWAYGGQGNTVGAKIIEAVTGDALPLAYLKHLHGPLGNVHTEVSGAHADCYSVPLDIARFGQMLLNRGAYGRLRFMRPETFAQMLPQRLTRTLGPAAEKVFGIGLDGSPARFGHGAASAATFHIEADRDLVVVMTRNQIGTNYDKYNGRFFQAIEESLL